ncbi:MAG: DNA replication/repair protein RecF [Actinomycetota bacterium]|nr:DNA replication/repair protein RecF [Actinomycetota bacterium]MDP2287365.1 DNA replication/repair protein RecF [Actinomycetota bacterium]
MWVSHLSLTDFRSYPQVSIDLQPGVTTFVGRNGQGKTNLVEAIGYIATLGSHRVASDAPLVRIETTQGIIRCAVSAHDREALVEIAIIPGKANKARVNRSAVTRVRDILGILRVVVFAPEDLALVKGDPSDRRRFLDEILVQRTPRLAGSMSDLDRILKQRNALLKSASVARKSAGQEMLRTLHVWDEQLATIGAELIVARLELLDVLTPPAVRDYEFIAQDTSAALELLYVSSLESALGERLPSASRDRGIWSAALLEAIELRRAEELNRGITLIGPHRDDLAIRMGPVPAKGYASHGESWSIALALRLACFDVLKADGEDPVLILDDVFAELDVARRERLAMRLVNANQVLITAAVDADIPAELSGSRFRVDTGRVTHDL